MSSHPRLNDKKDPYKRAAKQHVISHAVDSTYIASVQALALLAHDLIGPEQGPSTWGKLALLTRSIAHLGLSTEEDTVFNASFLGLAPMPSLGCTRIVYPPPLPRGFEQR